MVSIAAKDSISKAMELILTGDSISGKELERLGPVSKTFPRQQVLGEAIDLAAKIGKMSGMVARLAKQAVLTGIFPPSTREML